MPDNGNRMITDFGALVKRVEDKSVVLPDFQREFVWKEEERQRKLVASVLAKMPVGSILLLNSDPRDYSCKLIGRNTEAEQIRHEKVDFLLDGQQRITVLSNVFSNVIFDNLENYNKLVSPIALKRRFFLKLPKWKNSIKEKDLFGVHTLTFPSDYNEPDFLSSDVFPDIVSIPFTVSDNRPYNPNTVLSSNLTGFCTNYEDGYLIPLFLLVPTGDERKISNIKLIINKTLTSIADSIATEIQLELNILKVGSSERDYFIDEIFKSLPETSIQDLKASNNIDMVTQVLEDKKLIWKDSLKEYLQSCVRDMRLTQIKVDGTQRARAIDIYENLNRGGISLNTFDLIMARVATVDKSNFYKRIVNAMTRDRIYDVSIAPVHIRNLILQYINNKTYNATKWTNCYLEKRNEIVSRYIDVFLDVFGLYFNNQSFAPNGFKVDHMKRDKILQIDPHFIHDNCERIIDSIDRALFFFQTRCGIRNIQEINYSLMIVLVAAIFLNDEYFANSKYHDILEAWYWCNLFNGDYDKDQNTEMIRDLSFILETFTNQRSIDWIRNKRETVFDRQYFSDKDLLLMDRVSQERYPKSIIRTFICQYFLSRTYTTMFNEDEKVSVFSSTAQTLEAHHIIPLGSVASIGESTKVLRNDDTHICNSPLNFVFITKRDNDAIGPKSIDDYAHDVKPTALSSLLIQSAFGTVNFNNTQEIKNILENRYFAIKGNIKNQIDFCLQSWQ